MTKTTTALHMNHACLSISVTPAHHVQHQNNDQILSSLENVIEKVTNFTIHPLSLSLSSSISHLLNKRLNYREKA